MRRDRTGLGPLVEVVVDITGSSHEDVEFTVEGVLHDGTLDVSCVLLGDWSRLQDVESQQGDESRDLRLIRERYASDHRVSFADTLAPTGSSARFRLLIPSGWRPGKALDRVPREMQETGHGLRSVLLSNGQVARFELTAAYARALEVRPPDADLDDLVDEVAGSWWSEGVELGFVHAVEAPSTPGLERDEPTLVADPVPAADVSVDRRRMRAAVKRLGIRRRRNGGEHRTTRGGDAPS
jgi:hypothetical protein